MYIIRWYTDIKGEWVLSRSERRKDLNITVLKGQQARVYKYEGDYLVKLKVITG